MCRSHPGRPRAPVQAGRADTHRNSHPCTVHTCAAGHRPGPHDEHAHPDRAPTPTGTILLNEDAGAENGGARLPSITFKGGPEWKHSTVAATWQDRWSNPRIDCFVMTDTARQSMGGHDGEASAARAAHLAGTLAENTTTRVRPHPTTPVTVAHPQGRPVQFAAVSAQVSLKGRPVTYTVLARTMTRDTNTLLAILTCTGHDATSGLRVAQLSTSLQVQDRPSR